MRRILRVGLCLGSALAGCGAPADEPARASRDLAPPAAADPVEDHLARGEHDRARAILASRIEHATGAADRANLWRRVAALEADRARVEDALRAYDEVIAIESSHGGYAGTWDKAAYLHGIDRSNEARALFIDLLSRTDLEPGHRTLFEGNVASLGGPMAAFYREHVREFDVAERLEREADRVGARRVYAELAARAVDPTDRAAVLFRIAKTHEADADVDAALAAWDEAVAAERPAGTRNALGGKASYLVELERHRESLAAFEEVARDALDPELRRLAEGNVAVLQRRLRGEAGERSRVRED